MELKIIETRPEVKSVAVITPTIGTDHLIQCVDSVSKQTFESIKHYIVVDGPQYKKAVESKIVKEINEKTLIRGSNSEIIYLPQNVGKAFGENWYGHRIYAAFSFLFNEDAVCFLDEDNWFEPDHVQSLVDTMNSNDLNWAWSHRKIFSKEGKYLIDDNCESLGNHPVWTSMDTNQPHFHIDTSSYMVRRDVAARVAGAWYGQWGADRQYFQVLVQHFDKAASTKKHTLCYRLDGNTNSVSEEFFQIGNSRMVEVYGEGNFPWLK